MNLLAIIISLLLLSGYIYLIYTYSKDLVQTIFRVENKIYGITYCTCLLLPGFILILLFNSEKSVYVWDYSAYWVKAIHFTHSFFEDPLQEIGNVYASIKYDEYNTFPNLLISPFNALFGLSYNMYIFVNYLVYYVPFALVASNIIIRTSPGISKHLQLALPFFLLLFTPCLIPIRFGFVDIVGLVYIAIIISIFINSNYLRVLNTKQSILLGVMLLMLIFSRRWYAFWFVAFFVAGFITNVMFAIKHKDKNPAINSTINLTIAGVTAMSIMLIFFMPFFKMTVLKDYTDIYSAYRSVSLLNQLAYSTLFFGGFIILVTGIGIFLSFKKEKSLTIFMLLATTVITLHFTRVNDFGGHQHYYLLMPLFIIFFCKTLVYLDRYKFVVPLIFCLLLANNYFVFAMNNGSSKNAYVFSSIVGKRYDRADYDILMSISNKVAHLQDNGNYVYCIASGSVLNDDMLKNTRLPDINSSIFKLKQTQHVDKRDFFPNDLFLANYVIVTSPAQLHLGPENQKIVYYFNQEILEGQMKSHYEKVEEYAMGEGVTAFLMRKVTAFNNAEIQSIRDYFEKAYPDYKNMYSIRTNVFKTSEVIAGDGYGSVNFADDSNVEIVPGPKRASMITLQFDEKETLLSFKTTFTNKESIANECNAERDGEVNLTILENGKEIKRLYITHKQDVPLVLDVSGGKKITLIVDKGKNEDYCDWFKLTDFTVK